MEILKQEVRLVNTVLTLQDRPGGRTLGDAFLAELQQIKQGVHLIIDCSQVGDVVLKPDERNSNKRIQELLSALQANRVRNPFCLIGVSDVARWSQIASNLGMTVVSWGGIGGNQCQLLGRKGRDLKDARRLLHKVFFQIVSSHQVLHVGDFKVLGADTVQVVERLIQLVGVGLVVPVLPQDWTLAESNAVLYIFGVEKALDLNQMAHLFGVEMVERVLDKLGVRNPNSNFWYRNKRIRESVGFAVVRP
jgi:hypothetical protein